MNIPMNFFRTSYFTKQLQTTDCKGFLFRMSNYCCFRRAAQEQLSQCYSRNFATVLRAVVKSPQSLKGTKVFACRYFGKNLKNFSKFRGKSPCWSSFIVKLQTIIAFKKKPKSRLLSQFYQKKKKTSGKNYEHDYSARLPLKSC